MIGTMEEQEDSKEKKILRGISFLVTVLLILAIMLCLYVAVQVLTNGYANVGGFMMFRVVTGSMEPTIPVGALLVAQQVDIHTVDVNDIVCFRTKETVIQGETVTHRVVDVLLGSDGRWLLETKGDANPVADGYYVDQENFIGKVVWFTGDNSVLASIVSFFTNKVGFLGCIVFPCLMLAGLILRECVGNIQQELESARQELGEQEDWQNDPLCGMTPEEYEEMVARIRAELIEELMQCAEFAEYFRGESHDKVLEGKKAKTE